MLFVAYSLEGIGYIIAGTFLISAIDQSAPRWAGTGAWVLAGIALPALVGGIGPALAAAGAAGLLRLRFPHHFGPLPTRVQARDQPGSAGNARFAEIVGGRG